MAAAGIKMLQVRFPDTGNSFLQFRPTPEHQIETLRDFDGCVLFTEEILEICNHSGAHAEGEGK